MVCFGGREPILWRVVVGWHFWMHAGFWALALVWRVGLAYVAISARAGIGGQRVVPPYVAGGCLGITSDCTCQRCPMLQSSLRCQSCGPWRVPLVVMLDNLPGQASWAPVQSSAEESV